jgi:hypothetical protein
MLKKIILLIQKTFTREENHFFTNVKSPSNAPIFIVGAPRTGSTFLFQILLVRYRVTFISNLMALLPMFMSRISFLSKRKMESYTSVKSSDLVYFKGLFSPNEAGKINRFWFDHARTENEKSKIQKTFNRISNQLDASLVIKSLPNSLIIPDILEIFPNARFIYIKRDIFFNAQSILMCRKKVHGDFKTWFSLEPEGFKNKKFSNPFEEVVWQVNTINKKVEDDLKGLDFIEIDYDNLCENPIVVSELIAHKFNLKIKGNNSDKLNVAHSQKITLNQNDKKSLLKVIQEFK